MVIIPESTHKSHNSKTCYSYNEAINALTDNMAANGLPCDRPINVNTDRIQRYSADAKKNKKDEWYRAWDHGDFFWAIYFDKA